MKKLALIKPVILALTLLVGCGSPPETTTPLPTVLLPSHSGATPTPLSYSRYPLTVVDAVGNRMTINSQPERIVSLDPGPTEILYALDLEDQVVGVSLQSNYPPEAISKQVAGSVIDIDQIVELEADLVLAASSQATNMVPRLQELGIAVYIADPTSVYEVQKTILTIGHLTGHDQAAYKVINSMEQTLEEVQTAIENTQRPKVFWELTPDLETAGPRALAHDLISLAGGDNIAAEAQERWSQLTANAVLLSDPDVIVLSDSTSSVVALPEWEGVSAVQTDRVVKLSSYNTSLLSRPGPRIVELVSALARIFHPDCFE